MDDLIPKLPSGGHGKAQLGSSKTSFKILESCALPSHPTLT